MSTSNLPSTTTPSCRAGSPYFGSLCLLPSCPTPACACTFPKPKNHQHYFGHQAMAQDAGAPIHLIISIIGNHNASIQRCWCRTCSATCSCYPSSPRAWPCAFQMHPCQKSHVKRVVNMICTVDCSNATFPSGRSTAHDTCQERDMMIRFAQVRGRIQPLLRVDQQFITHVDRGLCPSKRVLGLQQRETRNQCSSLMAHNFLLR